MATLQRNQALIKVRSPWAVRATATYLAAGLALAATAAAATWYLTAPNVPDLGVGSNLATSGLHEQWLQGNVVVMVRHAERCDRSANPCLGDPQGITVNGRDQALAAGAGLHNLGLGNATLMSGLTLRTQQTAQLLAGGAVASDAWADQCDGGFRDLVLGHKTRGKNLVVVTHSGCVDQFERTLRVAADNRKSEYAQAFFIQADGTHAPKILGALTAQEWKNLSAATWH